MLEFAVDHRKAKSLGYYPTPQALIDTALSEYLELRGDPPDVVLEPAAGDGRFLISYWQHLLDKKVLTKRQLDAVVEKSIAVEIDPVVFKALQSNIRNWLGLNKVKAAPTLLNQNFLLDFEVPSSCQQKTCLVLGNPPWDEFTTRKHDEVGHKEVRAIRNRREVEKEIYARLGCKNLYQAFIHKVMSLNSRADIVFVLPRQILGDQSALGLREQLAHQSDCYVSVFKNNSDPKYQFPEIDPNTEIALITRCAGNPKGSLAVRRGVFGKYLQVSVSGSDFTIPCPPASALSGTLKKLLKRESLGSWGNVKVSRGKTDYTSASYKEAVNGRTVKAYDTAKGQATLVVNKILPNSQRKLKAALVSKNQLVSDAMLTLQSDQSEHQQYLLLMLNSRPVELALRSLTSNINLNNFRLLSLPIPRPSDEILKVSKRLVDRCLRGDLDWELASDSLCETVFDLTKQEIEQLQEYFPNR